ncbi:hypothetical protein NDU88_001229 [Pleurodeles waltl]|uniref:Uncharacterized protein n=1 Tax=Pleurodeles waltl TaxID=8319 RepID=A0AAV7KPU5_PLEWA|nr:hypothetical protein NDU88_001229 [Pleurodeles waltl]
MAAGSEARRSSNGGAGLRPDALGGAEEPKCVNHVTVQELELACNSRSLVKRYVKRTWTKWMMQVLWELRSCSGTRTPAIYGKKAGGLSGVPKDCAPAQQKRRKCSIYRFLLSGRQSRLASVPEDGSSPVNPFEAARLSDTIAFLYRAENRLGMVWQRIASLAACNDGGDSGRYWSAENVSNTA